MSCHLAKWKRNKAAKKAGRGKQAGSGSNASGGADTFSTINGSSSAHIGTVLCSWELHPTITPQFKLSRLKSLCALFAPLIMFHWTEVALVPPLFDKQAVGRALSVCPLCVSSACPASQGVTCVPCRSRWAPGPGRKGNGRFFTPQRTSAPQLIETSPAGSYVTDTPHTPLY